MAATSAIFQGIFSKLLKSNINLFDKAFILTGTADPSSVATNAPKGSIYLRQTVSGDGQVYKKNDSGSSTNWSLLFSSVNASAAYADLYDLSSTTLPTSSAVIDGITVVSGHTAFFSNLSSNNAQIYKASAAPPAWSLQYTDINTLRGVYALSSSIAYVVGNGGRIAKTINGSSWATQTSGTATNLRSIFAFDANSAIAVGLSGVARYTTDGGTSWLGGITGTANSLFSVCMVSATVAYACGLNGTVIKTTDGGANWSTQTTPPAISSEQLNSIRFLDANIGWAVGGNGTIIYTTDGGTNWIQQTSGTSDNLTEISIVDANNAFIANNNSSNILFTTSSGSTWGFITASISNRSIYAYNTSIIWITNNNQVYKTINGGSSWTLEYSFSGTFPALAFVPGSQTAAWMSTDEGNVYAYLGTTAWTAQSGVFKNGSDTLTTGESVEIGLGTKFSGHKVYKDGSGNFLVNDSVRYFNGNKGTDFIEQQPIRSVTLTDNTTGAVVLAVPVSGYQNMVVDYSLSRGSGNNQTGTLYICTDGTTVSVSASSTEIGTLGTTFSGDINSGNIRLLYTTTSTGTNVSMKYAIKRWGL